ncbi:helix-turn-helix domain-containing protein [Streptomyces sp. NPDC090022]|uniref:helix-turn-helix domain-containing protein n=1 Tax=Streptomyces sp. NPDC090022 TaxID=3365920 RepID=UPI00381CBB8C
MADQHLSAPRRAAYGIRHNNRVLRGRYVKISNLLAQHRELSITAIGLSTHIQSLPAGTKVTIKSLAERFPEGEVRIAAALKELEEHGYLARYSERTAAGTVVSHVVSYNVPAAMAPTEDDDDPTPPEPPPVPEPPTPDPAPEPAEEAAAEAEPPEPVAPVAPETLDAAKGVLTRLRLRDPRLLLSERDVNRLAPAVAAWLERGIRPSVVGSVLAGNLPVVPIRAPAALLAYRLREMIPARLLPPPAPEARPPADRVIHPFVNCEDCGRAFRAPRPGHCHDCAPGDSAVA